MWLCLRASQQKSQIWNRDPRPLKFRLPRKLRWRTRGVNKIMPASAGKYPSLNPMFPTNDQIWLIVYVGMCVYKYLYIYIYIYTHKYVYVYIYVYIHTPWYIYIYIYIIYLFICLCLRMYIYIYIYMCMYTYIYVYVCIHICYTCVYVWSTLFICTGCCMRSQWIGRLWDSEIPAIMESYGMAWYLLSCYIMINYVCCVFRIISLL